MKLSDLARGTVFPMTVLMVYCEIKGWKRSKVESVGEARKIKSQVVEIIYLGDMLVAFGEFLRNNHQLLPAGWCRNGGFNLEKSPHHDVNQEEELKRFLHMIKSAQTWLLIS